MEKITFHRELPLSSFQFKSASKVEVLFRKDIEARLIAKALKDEGFKNDLLQNGKTVMEQLFDIRLPETMSVQVVEETESLIYLVIPQNPYAGIPETEIQNSLGMNLEDIAAWVLEQQKGLLPEDKQMNVNLVAKAWRDESFKKLLLSDPVLIIEHELGKKIEESVTIKVLEETPDIIYIVIPYLAGNALAQNEVDTSLINLPLIIGSGNPNNPNNPRYTDASQCPAKGK